MAQKQNVGFIPGKTSKPVGPQEQQYAYRDMRVPATPATPMSTPPGKKSLGNMVTMSGVQDLVREVTGNPIGAAALTAGISGIGGYLLAPYIAKILQPGVDTAELEEYNPSYRTNLALMMAGLGGIAPLAFNFNHKLPGYGLTSYVSKKAAFDFSSGHDAPEQSIALGDAYREIANSTMTPQHKDTAITMLNAFNAPPDTHITTDDIIGAAISTGISAATGGALGYLTASAIGLPHPGRTALLFGIANSAIDLGKRFI